MLEKRVANELPYFLYPRLVLRLGSRRCPKCLVGSIGLVSVVWIRDMKQDEERNVAMCLEPRKQTIDELPRRLASTLAVRRIERAVFVQHLEPLVHVGQPAGERHRRRRPSSVTRLAKGLCHGHRGRRNPIRKIDDPEGGWIKRRVHRGCRYFGPCALRDVVPEERPFGSEA